LGGALTKMGSSSSRGDVAVSVLYDQGVEIPSDLAGLIYIPRDDFDAWRLALFK
jgi:predicted nucleotide-binding protein